jgi:RHS repeat-associated protein
LPKAKLLVYYLPKNAIFEIVQVSLAIPNKVKNKYAKRYPFGMMIEERSYTATAKGYRFGFNGKEQVDEVSGSGNAYDFGARIYDSRLGRWMSVDPLQQKYASLSPYNFAGNSPISFKDPDGQKIVIYYKDENGKPQQWEYRPGLTPPDNVFLCDVIASIDYINESRRGAKQIKKAIVSEKTVNVFESDETQYLAIEYDKNNEPLLNEDGTVKNPEYNHLNYYPSGGLALMYNKGRDESDHSKRRMTGEVQSPALGFYHELSHFIADAYHPRLMAFRQSIKSIRYSNFEERRAVKSESKAGRELREPIRRNHSGSLRQTETVTSKSNERSVKRSYYRKNKKSKQRMGF